MPFRRNVLLFLTIPGDAGPGDARIVITSQLPPPLDTYLLASGAHYSSAIIYYANDSTAPFDQNYIYEAVVDNGLSVFTETHIGRVFSGAVVESAAGVPDVLSTLAQGAGTSSVTKISADSISLISPAAAVTLDSSSGRFTANAAPNQAFVDVSSAGVDIQAKGAGDDITLTAADDILLTADGTNTTLNLTSSITATANAGDVILAALGDVNLNALDDISLNASVAIVFDSGGDTTSEGDLLGLRNDNECTTISSGGNTSSSSYANMPGVTALSITKRYANSALLVTFMPSFYVTVADTGPKFGVAIGSTDYDIIKYPQTLPSGERLFACGQRKITGIAAGSVTLTARWARLMGTGTVNVASNAGDDKDWYSFTVQEVAA